MNRDREDISGSSDRSKRGWHALRQPRGRGIAAFALLLATVALAGCGGSSNSGETGSTAAETEASGGKSTVSENKGNVDVIGLGGPQSDPFWQAIEHGFTAAGEDLGIEAQYVGPSLENFEVSYAQAVENAIARKPSALIVGEFFPSVGHLVKKAVSEEIPVVVFNSGLTTWEGNGALGYVGEDSYGMGETAGKLEAEAGVKNGMCVNSVPGNPTQEERCSGYESAIKAGGGQAFTFNVPYNDTTNPTASTEAIKGALASHQDVDGIYTISGTFAPYAQQAVEGAGMSGQVTIGTNDPSTQDLNEVKSGKLLFVLDQQPYLQGYYAVVMADQFVEFGLKPAGPIPTGPFVVNKANADEILSINEENSGVRGAS